MKRGPIAGKRLAEKQESPFEEDNVTPLVDTVRKTAGAVGRTDRMLLNARMSTPVDTATRMKQILKEWEESGAMELFKSERSMSQIYQASMMDLFIKYTDLLSRTLTLLYDKIEDPDLTANQMLAIVERLSEQIGLVKQQVSSVSYPLQVPDTVEELDARLEAARIRKEARLQLQSSDNTTVSTTS